jgi:predicted esterase YcpF (UPF0227 family)
MKFIYLHGFNSAFNPESDKIKNLEQLGEVVGINYDSFGSYKEIFSEITSKVDNTEDVVFVGTSLGGFWAAEMGRHFGVPSVIINPCYDPYRMLRKSVGIEFKNFVTNEVKILTNSKVETYPLYSMSGSDRTFKFLPLVLLDMNDEVIDSNETSKVLEGFPMKKWSDGSHRFDHMNEALEPIYDYLTFCNVLKSLDSADA